MSATAARTAGSVLVGLSIFAAVFVGPLMYAQIVGAAILVLSYSRLRLRAGWAGNVVTAGLSVLPWTIPPSLSGNWDPILFPAITTFLLVLSREILLDIEDEEGDRQFHLRTVPLLWGHKVAAGLSSALLGALALSAAHSNQTASIVLTLGFYSPSAIIGWILLSGRRRLLSSAAHLGKIQFCSGILAWWLASH